MVTDGGCSIVADAQGAARAVEAMKTHLVDVEVCKMGAAVLYVTWLSEKIWEKKTAHVDFEAIFGILSFRNSEVLVETCLQVNDSFLFSPKSTSRLTIWVLMGFEWEETGWV